MALVEGETLEDRLKVAGGKLPLEQALEVWLQLCDVLDYLHSRQPPIIFRDLKPGNVMLDDKDQVKLVDFGIAILGNAKARSLGTPGYAPPEQYGNGQVLPESDVYSLAVLLLQCLTGREPENFLLRPSEEQVRLDPLYPPDQQMVSPALVKLDALIQQ